LAHGIILKSSDPPYSLTSTTHGDIELVSAIKSSLLIIFLS
jgi:secondary thiamine-phosphate synthase enzyme